MFKITINPDGLYCGNMVKTCEFFYENYLYDEKYGHCQLFNVILTETEEMMRYKRHPICFEAEKTTKK